MRLSVEPAGEHLVERTITTEAAHVPNTDKNRATGLALKEQVISVACGASVEVHLLSNLGARS